MSYENKRWSSREAGGRIENRTRWKKNVNNYENEHMTRKWHHLEMRYGSDRERFTFLRNVHSKVECGRILWTCVGGIFFTKRIYCILMLHEFIQLCAFEAYEQWAADMTLDTGFMCTTSKLIVWNIILVSVCVGDGQLIKLYDKLWKKAKTRGEYETSHTCRWLWCV